MTYTTQENIMLEMPPGDLPDDVDNDYFDAVIADASDEVDTRVSMMYERIYASDTQKFPDIDDDPATPRVVERMARYLAASLIYTKLGYVSKYSMGMKEVGLSEAYEDRFRRLLRSVNNGDVNIVLSDGTALGGATGKATIQSLEMDGTDTEDAEHWTKVSLYDND